ncbi:Rhodanese-related sulfurtransferase [Allopseudospirillum japonicum]|uniref:Rhodanese-related sulfurtransferase n=1 Tax=Allopseudospirillum japonicum TaxID=64971 RepID=A0A1H6SMZ6_9GAMM|nr:rhodanese-like domain-containing protein [Allopseudospirillum japonicum]SEI64942.1 Rhodanese-related sulfurtransferase [Allopseudospirillum japonicum]
MSHKVATDFVAEAKAHIREVTPTAGAALLDQGAIALDVREPQEFMQGHLPKAVMLPRGVLEFRVLDHPQLQDKAQKILVYCQAGGRGVLATRTLQDMGFTQVVNLAGGFSAWQEAQQRIEKDPAAWA